MLVESIRYKKRVSWIWRDLIKLARKWEPHYVNPRYARTRCTQDYWSDHKWDLIWLQQFCDVEGIKVSFLSKVDQINFVKMGAHIFLYKLFHLAQRWCCLVQLYQSRICSWFSSYSWLVWWNLIKWNFGWIDALKITFLLYCPSKSKIVLKSCYFCIWEDFWLINCICR